MDTVSLNLVAEDQLSEVVAFRLLAQSAQNFHVMTAIRTGGKSHIVRKVNEFNRSCTGYPFFVLVDLDQDSRCASDEVRRLLPNGKHQNMLLRVCVVEVESWILADVTGLQNFLRVGHRGGLPGDLDEIRDPKQILVNLARRSRSRKIREDIVPREGSTSVQGPNYNRCLSEFVENNWNIQNATGRSDSLRRTVNRLNTFSVC